MQLVVGEATPESEKENREQTRCLADAARRISTEGPSGHSKKSNGHLNESGKWKHAACRSTEQRKLESAFSAKDQEVGQLAGPDCCGIRKEHPKAFDSFKTLLVEGFY